MHKFCPGTLLWAEHAASSASMSGTRSASRPQEGTLALLPAQSLRRSQAPRKSDVETCLVELERSISPVITDSQLSTFQPH